MAENWGVTLPAGEDCSLIYVRGLCLQNWELFATLFGRLDVGPKLIKFTVTHVSTWYPGWCVWYWGFSADNSSRTHLIPHLGGTGELSFCPHAHADPQPCPRLLSPQRCSPHRYREAGCVSESHCECYDLTSLTLRRDSPGLHPVCVTINPAPFYS